MLNKSLPLALLFISTIANAAFQPAELAKNKNSTLLSDAKNGTRSEAWVKADFMVDAQGQPTQLMFETSNPDYYSDAESYLKQLSYTPAQLDGKTQSSAAHFTVKFNKVMAGVSNDSLSSTYAKYFDQTKKLVVNAQPQAKQALADLAEDHTKNLTERAYTAWLYSVYYSSVKDWYQYGIYVDEAALLFEHLTPDLALMALQNLMNLQVYNLHFADAKKTLLQMSQIKYKSLSQQTVDQFTQQLEQLMQENPSIEINARLVGHRTWRHTVNRNTIALATTQGKVSAATLYCQNGYHLFKQQTISSFTVPTHYGECYLAVQGDANTHIKYTESGDSRFGMTL